MERGPTATGINHKKERAGSVLIAGLVIVVSLVWYAWHGQAPAGPPKVDPALVPLATGEEPLDQLFARSGCVVCHTIPGISGAEGQVGPKLTMGDNAVRRLSDPAYQGQANTVREYIIESILAPGAYVVPGYPPDVMPVWYGKKLSAGALDKMGAYLESLREPSGEAVLR